jgi:hypothetical protein
MVLLRTSGHLFVVVVTCTMSMVPTGGHAENPTPSCRYIAWHQQVECDDGVVYSATSYTTSARGAALASPQSNPPAATQSPSLGGGCHWDKVRRKTVCTPQVGSSVDKLGWRPWAKEVDHNRESVHEAVAAATMLAHPNPPAPPHQGSSDGDLEALAPLLAPVCSAPLKRDGTSALPLFGSTLGADALNGRDLLQDAINWCDCPFMILLWGA